MTITKLHRYLARLYDTILSRREIEVEELQILDRSDRLDAESRFAARLRFWDGSLLQVEELLRVRWFIVEKTHYAYHYQHADGSLIFRYDNAPHHPELPGFPCHKHTPAGVQPAEAPDLSEVLREIDGLLYPDREER